MRVLAPALRRNAGDGAFDDLEQRLLHALAGDIAGDGRVFALAGDLVNLVDIDDAALRRLNVVIGILNQAQQDVLHILADIACLGKVVASAMAKGTFRILARDCARNVLPQPVGPTMTILDFCSSTSPRFLGALILL